ncbi:hypothetical protein ACFPRL_28055 [Pseudoclavibacter helvolus]
MTAASHQLRERRPLLREDREPRVPQVVKPEAVGQPRYSIPRVSPDVLVCRDVFGLSPA